MLAVIHRSTPPSGAGALALAGPPVVIRQLQWLHNLGSERVAIELGQDELGAQVRRLVSEQKVLSRGVVFVPAITPLSPRALGQAAGFPTEARWLALSESVVGNADLTRLFQRKSVPGALVGRLDPPKTGGPFSPAEVHLTSPIEGPVTVESLPGWGTLVDTPGTALQLACEALLGRLALLIHAAETWPGVWVARGGRIDDGAELSPPVLIGAGARVYSGARVGPGALIGARALIEPRACIEQAIVENETIVGEGLVVREHIATPWGLIPLKAGADMLPLRDPLLVARRAPLLPARLTHLLRIPP
ncbi:hypothetical protein [Hyalangium sp.]|uniref:hypothetical protein n=1 Tax=Hyalangium sp. TaxID=2028555 RepID=UPI002D3BAD01|nr:hypothetical protein [Hyalangium sp.]HYI01095.1 hypothetical protein [Hyalangium sp.]